MLDYVAPTPQLLSSPVRRDMLNALGQLPVHATQPDERTRAEGLTAAELSERLGLHVTTIRFHIDQLLQAGLVEAHDVRAGVGRPRRHYTLHPGRLDEVSQPDAYRALAELLSESLFDGQSEGRPLSAEEAAHRWVARRASELIPATISCDASTSPGHFLAKVGVIVDLLSSWGYCPSVNLDESGHTAEVRISGCPLRDLALQNPAVACGVHRGLLQASMTAMGEQEATVGLFPFAEPDLCIATITSPNDFNHQEDTNV